MHDEENYRYITTDGNIMLTPTENKILSILFENKELGIITTYDTLSQRLYNCPCQQNEKISIRKFINILREKLKGEVSIRTLYKIGYTIL